MLNDNSVKYADEILPPGNALHFEVMFSENVALAPYQVSMHSAFDGHTNSHNSTTNGLADYGVTTRVTPDSVAFEKTWLKSDFIARGETSIAGKKKAAVKHLHKIRESQYFYDLWQSIQ